MSLTSPCSHCWCHIELSPPLSKPLINFSYFTNLDLHIPPLANLTHTLTKSQVLSDGNLGAACATWAADLQIQPVALILYEAHLSQILPLSPLPNTYLKKGHVRDPPIWKMWPIDLWQNAISLLRFSISFYLHHYLTSPARTIIKALHSLLPGLLQKPSN